MSQVKVREMEAIFESYEFFIREKLEELDFLSRKMFAEIGIFSVPKDVSHPFVQEKVRLLALDIVRKGDESFGSHRVRASKTKYT